MKQHSNSSPNLRFLKPARPQMNKLQLFSRKQSSEARYQTLPTEQSQDKTINQSKYKSKRSARIALSNQLVQTKQLQKQPTETLLKKRSDLIKQLHSCIMYYQKIADLTEMIQKKTTQVNVLLRPNTSSQSNNILKLMNKSELPREQTASFSVRLISTNKDMSRIYYISDLLKAYIGIDNYFNRIFRDHFNMSYYSLRQCSNQTLLYKPKQINLPKDPKDAKQYTILFDLDETLVHCSLDLHSPSDKRLTIKLNADETLSVGLNIRPGLQAMLDQLVPNFELIVFTASHGAYARKIIEYIDTKRVFSYILTREHCCYSNQGYYLKDLSIIKNRSLSKMVLVDNAACSYYFQQENGIPIIPFYDNRSDKQLSTLTKYLTGMIGQEDLRDYNKQMLKLNLMNKGNTPEDVFQMLKIANPE